MKKAYLILADGSVFEGESIGAEGSTLGETVFTTGMTGYVETLTDPSYFGQIVTQSFPLIGNYGFISEDFESKKSYVQGYIVREMCDYPSNFRCQGRLGDFLKNQGIVGICGIDTRALVKKIREAGVMNGMIVSGDCPQVDEKLLEKIRAYKIVDAVKSVSGATEGLIEEGKAFPSLQPPRCSAAASATPSTGKPRNAPSSHSVALWDFGAKANIQRELEKRGCKVKVLPYSSTAEEILALNPDGLMLSNGPGDPAENTKIIEELKKICDWNKKNDGKLPIFGICLGHQLLALARGAKTTKLKYGHRGGNHPVKDLESGRVFITSQNHGYAVESDSLGQEAKESFVNVNDNTCEGVRYTDIPAFSVQFHPEACGGPHDTNFLFDCFIDLMEKN